MDFEEVSSVIFSWNLLLAKYGVEIRKIREKFIEELNERLTKTYRSIAENTDEVFVEYKLQGENVSENEYVSDADVDIDDEEVPF